MRIKPLPLNTEYLGTLIQFCEWFGGYMSMDRSEDHSISIGVKVSGDEKGYYEKRVYDVKDFYDNFKAYLLENSLEKQEWIDKFEKDNLP